jgi:protein TonB
LNVQKEEEPSPDEFIVTDQDYNEVVSRVLGDLQRRVVYPEMARRAGVEGRVSVKVLIGKDGRPKPGRTIIEETASELLNPAAVKAIMAQVFPPATQNGQPVEVWVVIPIVFRLR